jgi:signal transduction histidine kinase
MVGGQTNSFTSWEGKMTRKELKNQIRDPNALRISIMFLVCTLLYYMPTVVGSLGGAGLKSTLTNLHNFYGLDFFAILFFVPVVYAAYSIGVIRAVLVAFAAMIVLFPYSIFITNQPGALFKPTAFVLILSAVGAAVAMLQRGDEQRRRSLNELKCLYMIGKAAESNPSVENFLNSVVSIIRQNLNRRGEIEVGITCRSTTYFEVKSIEYKHRIKEDIVIAGEILGSLEVAYSAFYPWDKKSDHFIKTLAERIGGAIHSIEIEQSLKLYYEQLEVMVEARTHELEQAQEKLIRSERLAAVGELASGVGHELRNPLNVIRNCVYLINLTLDGKAPADVEDSLKLLDMQVDIANKIVSDLLDYTRIKKPVCASVDLNSMIRDRVSWATVPEKVSIKLNLSIESPCAYVDPEQIGRAVTNVINNGVQSISSEGEMCISSGTNDGFAWVKFTDTGCGIPPENLGKIFEPLFTTKPKGIGLGLAISKRMIDQNRGQIEVESKVGKGTTFTLRLPLEKKEDLLYETASQYSRRG